MLVLVLQRTTTTRSAAQATPCKMKTPLLCVGELPRDGAMKASIAAAACSGASVGVRGAAAWSSTAL